MKITCIGAGYVGAPTSAVLAKQCPDIQVVVVDISVERIEAFNSDKLPLYEPGLDQVVHEVRGRNLHFSTDCARHIADADIIFVSVNTPTKKQGFGAGSASDLSAWESAGRSIAAHAKGHKIVVEKSTVPVRTAAALLEVLEANTTETATFTVLSNPEFLAEGTAIRDLLFPDRVLIGGDLESENGRDAVKLLKKIYSNWVPQERILTTDLWSSELSKLAANAFLAQRVSSINSIALICEKTGANVTEVARAIGMDSRLGPNFLRASVGFGGSCFKKDILNLVYLCRTYGLAPVADYWQSVVDMNELSKVSFTSRIVAELFGTLRNKKIAVFGFAFKKDTADVRETAAVQVCLQMIEEGAQIHVHDPLVTKEAALREFKDQDLYTDKVDERITFDNTPEEAVEGADAIAILTDWSEFGDLDYAHFYTLMRKPAYIFDGRLILDPEEMKSIGFAFRQLGLGCRTLQPPTAKATL